MCGGVLDSSLSCAFDSEARLSFKCAPPSAGAEALGMPTGCAGAYGDKEVGVW
jgi:hypothetical protein